MHTGMVRRSGGCTRYTIAAGRSWPCHLSVVTSLAGTAGGGMGGMGHAQLQQQLRRPRAAPGCCGSAPGPTWIAAARSAGWRRPTGSAARSSSRCRAWPACSQLSSSSPGVTRIAVTGAGGPPDGGKPQPRPRSKSRCGRLPGRTPGRGREGMRRHAVPGLAVRPGGSTAASRLAPGSPQATSDRDPASGATRRGSPSSRSIRGAAVDDHQRRAFGRGVVAQPREQARRAAGRARTRRGGCAGAARPGASPARLPSRATGGPPAPGPAGAAGQARGTTRPRAGSPASGSRAAARTAPRRS